MNFWCFQTGICYSDEWKVKPNAKFTLNPFVNLTSMLHFLQERSEDPIHQIITKYNFITKYMSLRCIKTTLIFKLQYFYDLNIIIQIMYTQIITLVKYSLVSMLALNLYSSLNILLCTPVEICWFCFWSVKKSLFNQVASMFLLHGSCHV